MLQPVRRIVTTNDDHGLSRVLLDGIAQNVMGALTELWTTGATPASNAGRGDDAAHSDRLEPPRHGTLFRFFQIAPEANESAMPTDERDKLWRDRFAQMGGSHLQPDTRRHPAMHKTSTTDYIVLLSGHITLLLDQGEVDLKPLDVVVQRGTNHAWVNRGSQDALLIRAIAFGTPLTPGLPLAPARRVGFYHWACEPRPVRIAWISFPRAGRSWTIREAAMPACTTSMNSL